MHTVRLLFDVTGWAYHRRCCALQAYSPDDFTVTIGPDYGRAFKRQKHDLALQLCYDSTHTIRRHIEKGGYDMVLVSGLNVSAASAKGYVKKQQQFADYTVLNSKLAWEKLNRPDGIGYISNGVDRALFNITVPPEKRTPRVLSIGSKFHQVNKGLTNILPELEKRLAARHVPCDFRTVDSHGKRMSIEQMRDYYNTGTVYVVASKNEGTPNPALEAASCGCVVVATAVGNMPELITDGENGFIVERELDALERAVLMAHEKRQDMQPEMEKAIAGWHWAERGKKYFDLFRNLIESGGKEAHQPRPWLAELG